MKNDQVIRVCGSVIKMESIIPITDNKLENTFVAEADYPYAGYYSHIPTSAKPNSLFLFTRHHYSLEDVLRFAQRSDSCLFENINLGAGTITFGPNVYPVIRVKYFAGYMHLSQLQECLMKQGVEFARKVVMEQKATIRINKCFELEEVRPGIYMDIAEKDKGYVKVDRLLTNEEFDELILALQNNDSCSLFDAVKCGIIIDSKVQELIRIYAEHLNLDQLQCIREAVKRFMHVAV